MKRINRHDMCEAPMLSRRTYEELDECCMAARWMLAYQLAREEDGTDVQGVMDAMQTVADYIDGPAGSGLDVFPDGSLIAWSQGEDTLYPDLDDFVCACGGDRKQVLGEFPGLEAAAA